MEIRSRFDSSKILYAAEADSIKELVEKAVRDGASLNGASLDGASLNRASLYGASLYRASLDGATSLVGDFPVFQITPIGSRMATLVAFGTNKGVMIKTSCFLGTINEFAAAVSKKHAGTKFEDDYNTAIELIKVHFAVEQSAGVAEK